MKCKSLELYLQKLDQIVVWKSCVYLFLGLLTDAVVNQPYSYFNFVFWHLYHLVFFDYFILVNWHRLLLCKQDKLNTFALACSMFIIHVPFCVKFSTFLRGDLFFYLCVSWGRAPTCLEFPRRLPLSRCRAGEWPDDKFISISRALLSLSNVVPLCIYQWKSVPQFYHCTRITWFLPWYAGRISYSIPFSNANLTNQMGRLE